jgi:hypothetical protein
MPAADVWALIAAHIRSRTFGFRPRVNELDLNRALDAKNSP